MRSMFKNLFCVFVVVCDFLLVALCSQQTLVEIDQGKVLGKIMSTVSKKSTYYSYKGIPYAKPPVSSLKFRPPEEHDGWKGTFEAFSHGSICVQSYEFSDDGTGSEDCLFLNVFTPKIKKNFRADQKPYPVMFFVHGGSFQYGSANTTIFGPDFFMDEKVILVTMNYRLGVHGFLDMENDHITGNMGLKDVFLALKWVRKNIKAFGGDVDNITIFGQGAGAAMVDILYLSPITKGMFSKAILQSQTAMHTTLFDWSPKSRAYNLTKHLNDEAHEDKSVVKVLNDTKPYLLPGNVMRTIHPDETVFKQIAFQIFSPTINKNSEPMFISKLPEDIYQDGDLPNKDIPIMIGFNSQESIYDNRFYVWRPEFVKNLNKRFAFTLPLRGLYADFDSDAYHSLHYRIIWFYFNVTIDITKETVLNEFLNYYSDITFIPLDQSVKAYAKLNEAPVYYYKFDYFGDLNYYRIKADTNPANRFYPLDGASERDELCYLFKCNIMKSKYDKLYASEKPNEDNVEEENKDLKTARKMVRMWTNFAKTGNPTPPDDDVLEGLNWEPVKEDKINYLHIADELKLDEDPNLNSVLFWQAMYEYYTPLAVDGILNVMPPGDSEEVTESEENNEKSDSELETDEKDEL